MLFGLWMHECKTSSACKCTSYLKEKYTFGFGLSFVWVRSLSLCVSLYCMASDTLRWRSDYPSILTHPPTPANIYYVWLPFLFLKKSLTPPPQTSSLGQKGEYINNWSLVTAALQRGQCQVFVRVKYTFLYDIYIYDHLIIIPCLCNLYRVKVISSDISAGGSSLSVKRDITFFSNNHSITNTQHTQIHTQLLNLKILNL